MMDLVKLGEPYSTHYLVTDLIEGYRSLIWTERYVAPGEFELKTHQIEKTRELLPEGTFVSHLETHETMVVETHEINMTGEGADALPELTVRGRSLDSIFEHRHVEANYQKKRTMRKEYTATGAAAVLIFNAVNNTSGADLTRGTSDPDNEDEQNHYPWNAKDALPNVAVSDSVSLWGPSRWWQLENGLLQPQLTAILESDDLGLRCVRPTLNNAARIVTVSSALASRGDITRTNVDNVVQLCFDIYKGTDRSSYIHFSQGQGHLTSVQRLQSNQQHKNVVKMLSELNMHDVYTATGQDLVGWRRRTMIFDAGTPELPPAPEKPDEPGDKATPAQRKAYRQAIDAWKEKRAKWLNRRGAIIDRFTIEQEKRAISELKKAHKIDVISGDVSESTPYIYNKDYFLGDTVSVRGDYDASSKMVVAEYIRTEDENGDRGIPGLVVP